MKGTNAARQAGRQIKHIIEIATAITAKHPSERMRLRTSDRRIRGGWQRGIWVAVAVALALLLPSLNTTQLISANAQAERAPVPADTIINFDNLTAGALLTSQYAADGVTFGVAAPFLGPAATMEVAADPVAFSAPNDAVVLCGEVCQANMWAEFSSPQQQVSMYLNNTGFNGAVSSTVNAYDGSGTLVASTPFTAQPDQWQQVSVNDPAGSIVYVEVVNTEVGCCPAFRMDNLSFTSSTQADFALVPDFDPAYGVGVPAGGTKNPLFTLRRFGGSADNISFSHNALPPGVSLTLSPNPDGNGDNTTVQGTITAAPGTMPVLSYPVTITATDLSSGTPHSVTFPLTVQGSYKLRVQGMEITQGVQNTTLPARSLGDLAAPVGYSGVKLVDDKVTAVRVFADAPGAPAAGILGVTAQLTGFRPGGQRLPGTLDASSSPNEGGTGGLVDTRSASLTVPVSERDSATGSFDFLLPASWDGQVSTLKVKLLPPNPGLFGPPPADLPCITAACGTLASMTLDNIRYASTGDLRLGYVLLTDNGAGFPLTESAFSWTRLIPDGNESSYPAPAGTLDIGWVLAGCPTTLVGVTANLCPNFRTKSAAALFKLEKYTSDAQTELGNSPVQGFVGVTNQNLGVEDALTILSGLFRPNAVVNVSRPLTSIDHEIGHMLGLPHASSACGGGANGQPSEPWPPDQQGELNSIGLNITGSPPFSVIAPPNKWFDFMSYCAGGEPNPDGTLGNTDAWVSARNWDAMAAELAAASAAGLARSSHGTAAGGEPLRPAGAATMRVYGFSDPRAGTRLLMVDPTPYSAPLAGTRSGFTVLAVSGTGKTTAQAPLYGQKFHVDGAGTTELLQGRLPLTAAGSAARLEVTHRGKVVATLNRPASKPALSLGKSLPSGKCAASRISVRWKVTDKIQVHLTAAVDFSADGGTTWAEVYERTAAKAGSSASGSVAIPRMLLKTTRHAQMRVRISDGYNQVTAQSARFCIAPSAPAVTITAPTAGQLSPGGTIALSGTAFDNGHPLTGTALTWRAYGPGLPSHGVRLGTGSPLVTTLPAAATKLTLTASSAGRSATAAEQATIPAITLKPQNGWTGGPFGTAQPSATLIAGIVHLHGAMATKDTNPVAFTLPPALRPAANVYIPADLCDAANGRLFIRPDGTVTVQAENAFSSAQCFTSLDGASYALQATVPLIPLNGWSGAPFGTAGPAATLVSGVVHLQGAITANGSTSQWVLTLPPAFRPVTDVYVPVDLCDAANGRLLIQPDGVVTVQPENSFTDAQCFTSLDGATFALTASTPLALVNGWSGAPFATSSPAAALVSGVVQLKGAISTTGTNPVAFTLPAGLRPAKNTYLPVDLCDAANGRLLIQPDGVVTAQPENSFTDAQCFTSLDGASFAR